MKKLLYLFGAMALMLGMVACGEEPNGDDLGDGFLDNVTLAGFYVYGPATGADNVVPENMMARGYNEVDKEYRVGMYEKYIWLEGGKDFWLAEYKGGELHYYSAVLSPVKYEYDENPEAMVHSGKLMDESDVPAGMEMPAMQVPEDGLYHIIFDTNVSTPAMPQAQIICMPVDWYINGGNVLGEDKKGVREVKEDGTITWTWDEVEFTKGAAFKFKYDRTGWKINLDSSGLVKAEISLGDKFDGENGLSNTTDKSIADYNDIILEGDPGVYTVTLTYNKTSGEVGDSFTYDMSYVRELNSFLIGGYELVKLHPGENENLDASWAVRYLTAGTVLDANSRVFDRESKQWVEETITTVTVENTGLTLIYFDNNTQAITLSEATIWAMGPVFEGNETYTSKYAKYTVNADGTVTSPAAVAAGVPRQYVEVSGVNWWQAEFVVTEGALVYRGAGGEVNGNADQIEAGQTLTIDFSNGTGVFK